MRISLQNRRKAYTSTSSVRSFHFSNFSCKIMYLPVQMIFSSEGYFHLKASDIWALSKDEKSRYLITRWLRVNPPYAVDGTQYAESVRSTQTPSCIVRRHQQKCIFHQETTVVTFVNVTNVVFLDKRCILSLCQIALKLLRARLPCTYF